MVADSIGPLFWPDIMMAPEETKQVVVIALCAVGRPYQALTGPPLLSLVVI